MPSVTAGYTFTGPNDPITYTKLNLIGQPTVSAVSTNDVTTSTIANLAVTTAKLADDAVTTAKIASGNTYDAAELSGGTTLTQSTPLYETATVVTWASTISLTFTTSDGNMREILINNGTSLNSTITPASVPRKGYVLRLSLLADATGGNTITFGTGFKTVGTLSSLTANKYYQITFVSNGTYLLEVSRTAAVG
jgi:Tfp pilus assembly protein PilX